MSTLVKRPRSKVAPIDVVPRPKPLVAQASIRGFLPGEADMEANATAEDTVVGDGKQVLDEVVTLMPWSLRFSSADLEAVFQAHHKQKYRRIFRFMISFILLWVLSTLWRPLQNKFWLVFVLKSLCAALLLVMKLFFDAIYRNNTILLPSVTVALSMFLLSRLLVQCDPTDPSRARTSGCPVGASGVRRPPLPPHRHTCSPFSLFLARCARHCCAQRCRQLTCAPSFSPAPQTHFRALESDVGFMYLINVGLGFLVGLPFMFSVIVCFGLSFGFFLTVWLGDSPSDSDWYQKLQPSMFVLLGFFLFNVMLQRKLELHERFDFHLTRRLKAENIHVNLEMEAFQLFSKAASRSHGSGAASEVVASLRVKEKDLRVKEQIGAGSFCDVYLGKWRATDVAIKKLRGGKDVLQDAIVAFGSELNILSQLRHPNICMMLGICFYPPQLLLELCSRGSLHRWLHLSHNDQDDAVGSAEDGEGRGDQLDMSLLLKLSLEAALGMAYLHQQGIIHRDLKSLNLLVTAQWQCKVSDFGISSLKEKATASKHGGRGGGGSSTPQKKLRTFSNVSLQWGGRRSPPPNSPDDDLRRLLGVQQTQQRLSNASRAPSRTASKSVSFATELGAPDISLERCRAAQQDMMSTIGSTGGSTRADSDFEPSPRESLSSNAARNDSGDSTFDSLDGMSRFDSGRAVSSGSHRYDSSNPDQSGSDDDGTKMLCSLPWAAPELFLGESTNDKIDVFAFGVVLYEVLARQMPYFELSPASIPHVVAQGDRPTDFYPLPSKIVGDPRLNKLLNLMEACWAPSPADRPSFEKIVEAFEGVDIGAIDAEQSRPLQDGTRASGGILTEFFGTSLTSGAKKSDARLRDYDWKDAVILPTANNKAQVKETQLAPFPR